MRHINKRVAAMSIILSLLLYMLPTGVGYADATDSMYTIMNKYGIEIPYMQTKLSQVHEFVGNLDNYLIWETSTEVHIGFTESPTAGISNSGSSSCYMHGGGRAVYLVIKKGTGNVSLSGQSTSGLPGWNKYKSGVTWAGNYQHTGNASVTVSNVNLKLNTVINLQMQEDSLVYIGDKITIKNTTSQMRSMKVTANNSATRFDVYENNSEIDFQGSYEWFISGTDKMLEVPAHTTLIMTMKYTQLIDKPIRLNLVDLGTAVTYKVERKPIIVHQGSRFSIQSTGMNEIEFKGNGYVYVQSDNDETGGKNIKYPTMGYLLLQLTNDTTYTFTVLDVFDEGVNYLEFLPGNCTMLDPITLNQYDMKDKDFVLDNGDEFQYQEKIMSLTIGAGHSAKFKGKDIKSTNIQYLNAESVKIKVNNGDYVTKSGTGKYYIPRVGEMLIENHGDGDVVIKYDENALSRFYYKSHFSTVSVYDVSNSFLWINSPLSGVTSKDIYVDNFEASFSIATDSVSDVVLGVSGCKDYSLDWRAEEIGSGYIYGKVYGSISLNEGANNINLTVTSEKETKTDAIIVHYGKTSVGDVTIIDLPGQEATTKRVTVAPGKSILFESKGIRNTTLKFIGSTQYKIVEFINDTQIKYDKNCEADPSLGLLKWDKVGIENRGDSSLVIEYFEDYAKRTAVVDYYFADESPVTPDTVEIHNQRIKILGEKTEVNSSKYTTKVYYNIYPQDHQDWKMSEHTDEEFFKKYPPVVYGLGSPSIKLQTLKRIPFHDDGQEDWNKYEIECIAILTGTLIEGENEIIVKVKPDIWFPDQTDTRDSDGYITAKKKVILTENDNGYIDIGETDWNGTGSENEDMSFGDYVDFSLSNVWEWVVGPIKIVNLFVPWIPPYIWAVVLLGITLGIGLRVTGKS